MKISVMINKYLVIRGLLLLELLILSYSAMANLGYAIVQDSDGYVNLRESQSLNSKIIAKVPNNTPLYCEIHNYDGNTRYCEVKINDDVSGYIHQSRLHFFNKSSEYKPFNITATTTTSATLTNQYAQIHIKLAQKTLNKSDFRFDKNHFGYLYQNKRFYGTDGGLPMDSMGNHQYSSHFYDMISLNIGNQTISIPKREFSHLFIPDYFVEQNEAMDRISAFINPKTNHVYLFLVQSDGAASYSVAFEFDHGRFIKKYLWLGI